MTRSTRIKILTRRAPTAAEIAARRRADKELEMSEGVLYVGRGRRRPDGWFLAHNHILHGKNTRNGINGFRYFWIKDRSDWSVCRCGWRPDWGVHYR